MAQVSLRRKDLSNRGVEQAILSLKKGAYLLKCGRRGKPKFRPFRLSADEEFLIWSAGEAEKRLKLSSVSKIIQGQRTANFLRHHLHEKESQSFSLVYQNDGKTLDLICKDKEQAECWMLALNSLTVISNHRPLPTILRNSNRSQTCSNSPISHSWRKQNVGYLDGSARFSRAHSLSGSPSQSLLRRHFSVSVPYSYNHTYCSMPKPLSSSQTASERKLTLLPQMVHHRFKGKDISDILYKGGSRDLASKVKASLSRASPMDDSYVQKDVFIWGEGIGGGRLVGGSYRSNTRGMAYDALLPKLLESTRTLDVRGISCGRHHASIVTRRGEVFTWGEESGGRLGHKIDMDVSTPKVVDSLSGVCMEATSCGAYHTCAVTSSGELYIWGGGCRIEGTSRSGKDRSPWLPHRISGLLEGIHISRVACGEWHTAVVTMSGQLFTFGDGTFGALGHGNLQSTSLPKEVESLRRLRVKSVACGPWHSAAIVEVTFGRHRSISHGGKLFTWGDNDRGKLGHADKVKKLLPKCVSSLVDCDFVQVACGDMLTVALAVTGIVYTMGSSESGQLGNPLAADRSITVVEGDLKNKHVKQISCGSAHVAIVTTKAEVYTWGKGANGRLGLGDTENRNSPSLVEVLKDRHVDSASCGSGFTVAICLQTATLGFNQSVCSGCKVVFSFTRKKHNCYNCGFAFCSSCTRKKAVNASLAPNGSRQFRVCDKCFSQINIHPSVSLKSDIQTPRALSWARKFFDSKSEVIETISVRSRQVSPYIHGHGDSKFLERQSSAKKGRSYDCLEDVPVLSNKVQRWGQVSCPSQFITWRMEEPRMSISVSSNDLSNFRNTHPEHRIQISRSVEMTTIRLKSCITETDAMLAEELERLRTEVKNLTKQCQEKGEKLLLYKQRTKETWSVARDEAAKCKAAKEIAKALASQINAMAGKLSAEKQPNLKSLLCEKLDLRSPQIRPVQSDLLHSNNVKILSNINHLSSDNRVLGNRRENQSCEPSLRPSDASHDNAFVDGINIDPSSYKGLKEEFMEQDELGVYITFVRLPNGKKGLQRIRFSQKHFTEMKARRWWEENHRRVYQKYHVERITHSGKNQGMRS